MHAIEAGVDGSMIDLIRRSMDDIVKCFFLLMNGGNNLIVRTRRWNVENVFDLG